MKLGTNDISNDVAQKDALSGILLMKLQLVFFGQIMHKSTIIHTMARQAWQKGVCHGRVAFDITFQHKTTFSTRVLALDR